MKKNHFKLAFLLLVTVSLAFVAFTPKSLTAKKATLPFTLGVSKKSLLTPYLDREIVIVANCHASFYRWTAIGFTGATSYAWYKSPDGVSNWTQFGGSTNTVLQSGDASCDPVWIKCIGYVNGVHTYAEIVESDLCVPYDWDGPECPYWLKKMDSLKAKTPAGK